MFTPKSCTKTSLARAFFPDASPAVARNRLARWIRQCTPLWLDLLRLGYRPAQRYFSRRQVVLITHYLGEP